MSGQYLGAGGSGPVGCSQFLLPGQHGDQSLLPEPDGKVPQTAGCEGGPCLFVCSLGQAQTGRQHNNTSVLIMFILTCYIEGSHGHCIPDGKLWNLIHYLESHRGLKRNLKVG